MAVVYNPAWDVPVPLITPPKSIPLWTLDSPSNVVFSRRPLMAYRLSGELLEDDGHEATCARVVAARGEKGLLNSDTEPECDCGFLFTMEQLRARLVERFGGPSKSHLIAEFRGD